jgi:hypothetical protein
MMEKNGMLTLTENDMSLYKEGKVSERLINEWELDFSSLDGMIKAGSYEVLSEPDKIDQ